MNVEYMLACIQVTATFNIPAALNEATHTKKTYWNAILIELMIPHSGM